MKKPKTSQFSYLLLRISILTGFISFIIQALLCWNIFFSVDGLGIYYLDNLLKYLYAFMFIFFTPQLVVPLVLMFLSKSYPQFRKRLALDFFVLIVINLSALFFSHLFLIGFELDFFDINHYMWGWAIMTWPAMGLSAAYIVLSFTVTWLWKHLRKIRLST